jgi:hypothetical protein
VKQKVGNKYFCYGLEDVSGEHILKIPAAVTFTKNFMILWDIKYTRSIPALSHAVLVRSFW